MADKTLQWHPLGKDIPVGYRVADQVASHHSAHAVLIEPDPHCTAIAAYAADVAALAPTAIVMGD